MEEETKKKKKPYRNFARSEKAIIRAYVELMQRGEKRITVTNIVDTADLNRSTFYAHFKTADDVREKIQSDIINDLLGSMNGRDHGNLLSDPSDGIQHVIDFLKKDEEMYKILLNTPGADKFLKKLKDIVIEQYMSDRTILPHIKDKEGFELNLRLFVGGFVSVIEDWAAGNTKAPLERCAHIISNSINMSVQRYLDKNNESKY